MTNENEPMPGSSFNAYDQDLKDCHEILNRYSKEAIQLAAEEVENQ